MLIKKAHKKGKTGNECWTHGRGENDHVEKGRCYRIFVIVTSFLTLNPSSKYTFLVFAL